MREERALWVAIATITSLPRSISSSISTENSSKAPIQSAKKARIAADPYTGSAAIRAFFADWIGAFDEFSVEIEELIDLGNDVIVAIATQSARSSRMQGYMRLHQASVFVWRDGLAAHVVHYR